MVSLVQCLGRRIKFYLFICLLLFFSPDMMQLICFQPSKCNLALSQLPVYFRLLRGTHHLCHYSLFRHFKQTYELAPYLTKVLNRTYRNTIAKLRLSSHPLLIETGRYTGIPRAERICGHCNSRDIEDEYHFVLLCSKYGALIKYLHS